MGCEAQQPMCILILYDVRIYIEYDAQKHTLNWIVS